MAPRQQLQDLLKTLCNNVYFQRPPDNKMQYPCIKYELDLMETKFADDTPYNIQKRYIVTVIGEDPDSVIPSKVAQLPMCRFDRFYAADNLNHHVFKLFF